MRTPTALAALLCAGLATSPALASSTTIIDFTIEITEVNVREQVSCVPIDDLPDAPCFPPITPVPEIDPLLAGKAVGDRFNGIIEIANPPIDILPEIDYIRYDLEAIAIDTFDPILFTDGALVVYPFLISIFSGSFSFPDNYFLIESNSQDLDPNEFLVSDLVPFMLDPEASVGFRRFFVKRDDPDYERTISSEVLFDVTSASIRPEVPTIPLPAAGWLMLAGLGGLAALRRRS